MKEDLNRPIKVVYLGTTELGVPALRLMANDLRFEVTGVVTQPDKPAGRGLAMKAPAVKTAALELGLRLIQPEALRGVPEVIEEIKSMEPEVIATAAYGLWIPDEVFDMPAKRTLNLHPSLLPRHRGAAPVVSAILEGEKEAGISVLFVEDEMDAGDILGQMTIPIGETETTESVMERCASESAEFFVETIYGWMTGDILPLPQDHDKSTWFGRMEKKEGLIDWSLSAAGLERRCRALTPWPGTYTFFKGKRLLIHRVSVLTGEESSKDPKANPEIPTGGKPGTVIALDSGAGVITGGGILKLEEVQLEYRKQMPIKEFLNGRPGFVGGRLG